MWDGIYYMRKGIYIEIQKTLKSNDMWLFSIFEREHKIKHDCKTEKKMMREEELLRICWLSQEEEEKW